MAEHLLTPGGAAIDGAALMSPQGHVLYAFGSLQSAFSFAVQGQDEEEAKDAVVRQQFVGLFAHQFSADKKAERLQRVVARIEAQDGATSSCGLEVDANPEEDDFINSLGFPTGQDRKRVCVTQEGFELLGHKLAVCRADTHRVLAISAHKGRGLVVHRLANKGDVALLLTFAPARPHTTQRIVGLADRFADMLRR